jgi:hypothetical protein
MSTGILAGDGYRRRYAVEILIFVAALVVLDVAAYFYGWDSRPRETPTASR